MRSAVTIAAVLAFALPAFAQEAAKVPVKAKNYTIAPTTDTIRIDGVLDEPVWQKAQPMTFDAETNPGDNITPPVTTTGYMTYDRNNLYVAFRADDPHPNEIRAHLSDRDSAFSDDFVGIVMDTFNDNRRAFEFFVNPLGVQMDLINDDTNGNEDSSWDAIWNTAGRITPEGYVVEMAIPFTSIRFPASEGIQTWGVDMVRIYPRSARHRIGLQGQDKNRNCYLCQSSRVTGFTGIKPGRDIELDPTLTAHQTETREGFPNGGFSSDSPDVEAGLSGRWGITPNLQLNAAINPDFSQVEADAVQLDINTQFALAYPEKRPFFLEGTDFFDGPLQAVYTRSVADPSFGLKLTGRIAASTIGAYVARDAITNLIIPGVENSGFTSFDNENLTSAFRYRYNIGETSTVGATLTSRDGTDYSNRLFGVDGQFRLTKKDRIIGEAVGSQTEYPQSIVEGYGQKEGKFNGSGGRLEYRHSSREWFFHTLYIDLGDDLRADSGFIPQVGYRYGDTILEYHGWGEQGKTWYSRYWIGGEALRAEKQNGDLLERRGEAWVAVQGPMQSFVQLDVFQRDRQYRGETFPELVYNFNANVRPIGGLYVFVNATLGDQIDFANVRPGDRTYLDAGVNWNIGRQTYLEFEQSRDALDVEGGRLFTADVSQLKAVYNLNIRTFVRAILQYTDIERDPSLYRFGVPAKSQRLFPQLLFSYKVNPQTVFFAGYSGTSIGGEIDGNSFDLREADRTFFMKIGYAWLF